jgi:hypothetical protein
VGFLDNLKQAGRVFDDPLVAQVRRVADSLELLVDLERVKAGLEPRGALRAELALTPLAGGGHPVSPEDPTPPALLTTDYDLAYKLELFARAQGFGENPLMQADPYGFAHAQGWIDDDGRPTVELPGDQP